MNHKANAILSACAILLGVLGFWAAPKQKRQEASPQAETAFEAPVPLEAWTADAGIVRIQTQQMIFRVFPDDPLPGQKTRSCDKELGEELRHGACWMETRTPPPCPKGKQWEEDGKCFRPVPKTAGVPTTGGGQVPAIAE